MLKRGKWTQGPVCTFSDADLYQILPGNPDEGGKNGGGHHGGGKPAYNSNHLSLTCSLHLTFTHETHSPRYAKQLPQTLRESLPSLNLPSHQICGPTRQNTDVIGQKKKMGGHDWPEQEKRYLPSGAREHMLCRDSCT